MHDLSVEEEEEPEGHLFSQLNTLHIQEGSTCHTHCVNVNYFNMPIRRKRSSPTFDDPRSQKAKVSSSWSRRDQRVQDTDNMFSNKRCIAWFHEYTTDDEDTLGPEGMEKFCEDIGVEPENIVMLVLAWKLEAKSMLHNVLGVLYILQIVMLVLAWKLEAKSMGFFTKAEWLKGMTDLQ
ncbi:Hypothetical predicted protein [Mytilus galloprovincialis]|uniref:Defective in cullin neddylation protein n=1 Tax=Mytilus galloprovincialis TaxID=29158 RepID=A0A8B6GW59_MYTGA|nr:Hypothetical predicted protein [Mytilus galloprovincialis]